MARGERRACGICRVLKDPDAYYRARAVWCNDCIQEGRERARVRAANWAALTETERAACTTRSKRRWATDPAHRASVLARGMRRLADPAAREAKLAWGRDWHRKRREDPAQLERDRARSRRALARLRQDPAYQARFRVYCYSDHGREMQRGRNNRRRARLATVRSACTVADRASLLQRASGRCVYCDAAAKLELDHFMPILRGGLDVATNLVPACLPCNRRKAASPPELWLASLDDAARLRARAFFDGGVS